MKKTASLVFIALLAASSILILGNTSAASIPEPSAPEFSIHYVEHPYEVPPTYQIDQHSGENITIQEGYHQQNRSIELVIQNQQFTPYEDSQGNLIELFYNVSAKGHYGDQWHYYPTWLRMLPITASDNQVTVLSFGLDVNYEENNQYGFWYGNLEAGDKEDFRVQALIGYYDYPYDRALEDNEFIGETSEWSSTQSITIPASASPSPSVPELSVIVILPLFLAIPLLMALLLKKNIRLKTYN